MLYKWRVEKWDEDPTHQQMDVEVERRWLELCEPDEELQVVCRCNTHEYYILTSKRLVVEGGRKPREIPLDTISKVTAHAYGGKKTGDPRHAARIELQTPEGKVSLAQGSGKFTDLAKRLLFM